MLISDLDYLVVELVFEPNKIVGLAGSTWTETYAVTSAGPGISTADAGASAFGAETLAATAVSVVANKSTTTGYVEKNTYHTIAEAEAIALASNGDNLDADISKSTSEYYSHSITVTAGYD